MTNSWFPLLKLSCVTFLTLRISVDRVKMVGRKRAWGIKVWKGKYWKGDKRERNIKSTMKREWRYICVDIDGKPAEEWTRPEIPNTLAELAAAKEAFAAAQNAALAEGGAAAAAPSPMARNAATAAATPASPAN